MKLGFKAEKIYLELKNSLASGKFLPGSRLPTEKELCEKLNASRNTVRGALKKMIGEGLLESIQGSGCYVKPADTAGRTVSFMYHGSMDMVIAVQNHLLEKGCLMSLFSQATEGWSPELEAKFLENIISQQHFGLIASCTPLEPLNENLLEKAANSGVRIVHTEPYSATELPPQNYCMPDYCAAGKLAVEHLAKRGETKIIYLDPDAASPYNVQMKKGVVKTAKKLGIKIETISQRLNGFENHIAQEKTAGIVTPIYALADYVNKQHGIDKSRIIAMELPGDVLSGNIPVIRFDRFGIFTESIDTILSPGMEVKKLIQPSIINKDLLK